MPKDIKGRYQFYINGINNLIWISLITISFGFTNLSD